MSRIWASRELGKAVGAIVGQARVLGPRYAGVSQLEARIFKL